MIIRAITPDVNVDVNEGKPSFHVVSIMAEEAVGINGFGRVGQMFLRMALERELRVVAINDPEIGAELMAGMLQRDSTQGLFFLRHIF